MVPPVAWLNGGIAVEIPGAEGRPESPISGTLLIAFHDDDAERHGRLGFAIEDDFEGVGATGFEAEGLEIEDHVAGDEVRAFRQADVNICLEGLHEVLSGGIDHADGHLVVSFVGVAEADAECEGTLGMHDGDGAGADGVESSEETQLAVVVHCGVTEGSYLNIHGVAVLRPGAGQCKEIPGGNPGRELA